MTKTHQDKARLEHMDIARGIGILLVVLGHNPACAKGTSAILVIYSFHVPLFFFLSGYFHKRSATLGLDIKKRAFKLLLPYFLTGLVLVLGKTLESPKTAAMLLAGMAWGAGGSGTPISFLYWAPVWFLTSLFVTQAAFSILQPALSRMPVAARCMAGALVLLVGIRYLHTWGLAYFPNSRMLPNEIGLPWNADLLPVTFFFYWLGWESGKGRALGQMLSHRQGTTSLLLLAPLFAGFCILHASQGEGQWILDLNRREYGQFLMTTLGALAGILFILAASLCLTHNASPWARTALKHLGMQSLVILVFHDFFQQQAGDALGKFAIPTWTQNATAWIFGVGGPLLLNRLLLQRVPWLRSVYGNASPAPAKP